MTQPLWTAAELRAATGGAITVELNVTGITIDSRAVAAGDLFIALRDARDGHDFAAAALAAGAACAMVDHTVPAAPLLLVGDTLAGLTALGEAGRARSQARFAAITGSVGKTTTKDMLRTALAACGPTHAAVASYNNHWGVPLTLARQPRDAAFAVIEIGMNHRGEIAPLARLARPHVAVITNVGTAHIGHLGSREEIAREKADIFQGLEPGGIGLYPTDGDFSELLRVAAGPRAQGFGEASSDSQLLHYAGSAEAGEATIRLHGETLHVALGAPGRHLAVNACAALAAAVALGAPPARAAAALAGFGAAAGRGARRAIAVPGGEALLLDDSYNASSASIRAALAVLAAQPAGRRLVVLGDMRELGEHGPALHAELGADVAAAADLAFCCGPLMAHLFATLPVDRQGALAADSTSLAPLVKATLRPGDAVLVKGSLGSSMAVIIRALTETSP